jgi:hypothetical protein
VHSSAATICHRLSQQVAVAHDTTIAHGDELPAYSVARGSEGSGDAVGSGPTKRPSEKRIEVVVHRHCTN